MKILSQRDKKWADIHIGKSKRTVGTDGCAITSGSSASAEINSYHNPGWMAQNLDFTLDGLVYWSSFVKTNLDFVYRFYYQDDAKIKKAFADPDQFILLQVNNNHWVFLVGIVGGYRVMDPYYGDIVRLTDRRYKITGFTILEKQDADEWTTNDEVNDEEPTIGGPGIDFFSLPSGSKFVDISHWNQIVDLSKTKSAGYNGFIHKCSQGVSNKDSNYIINKKRIRDINAAFGAYHYANATDPIKEADWFLKNIGEIRNGDILVLDYETYVRSDADDWCLTWMNKVKEMTDKEPILYTYHGIINKYQFKKVAAAGYKLWAARYGLQEQEPNAKYKPATGAFKKAWAWQYCSFGKVPGIDKRVDLNIIN
jgi:GH25 family lysozyme M1 (1,4-beta-N-acetylmuramidase)